MHIQSSNQSKYNPSWRFYIFIMVYRIIWYCLLPIVFIYLFKKSKKEPLYRQGISERLGIYLQPIQSNQPLIWIHAASMGELKAIVPLVSSLLKQGYYLLITTLTPAGKQTATQYFLQAIERKQLYLSYAPLEFSSTVKRFITHYQPICALMAEIDSWPILLTTFKKNHIPIGFINAQYPKKSFERDSRWGGVRRELFSFYDFIACKSATHAQRFAACGQKTIHIVGELRFDLPVPIKQINQANLFKSLIDSNRPIITLASIVAEEEDILIPIIEKVIQYCTNHQLPQPFWIIVPRSPQRFQIIYQKIRHLNTVLRSDILDADLSFIKQSSHLIPHNPHHKMDHTAYIIDTHINGLVGDSLGEMYFYLQPADCVVVGASFVPLGSHNIIEPIALKKPVIVGHSIWGIEYPGIEALAAGILHQCLNEEHLFEILITYCHYKKNKLSNFDTEYTLNNQYESFYTDHTGSTLKHLNILQPWLNINNN